MSSENPAAAALDLLIPGDGARWPPFSAAVDAATFAATLEPALSQMLPLLATREAIERWQGENAAAFQALLIAAYRAYYTAPYVLEIVRDLADEGPREPGILFDPTLVAGVVAGSRGRRRL